MKLVYHASSFLDLPWLLHSFGRSFVNQAETFIKRDPKGSENKSKKEETEGKEEEGEKERRNAIKAPG